MNTLNSIGTFIPVSEIFTGVESNIETLKNLLSQLSRTDTLFWCARLNNVVSSSKEISHITRQQFGLNQFLTSKEIDKVNNFVRKKGGSSKSHHIF